MYDGNDNLEITIVSTVFLFMGIIIFSLIKFLKKK